MQKNKRYPKTQNRAAMRKSCPAIKSLVVPVVPNIFHKECGKSEERYNRPRHQPFTKQCCFSIWKPLW